MRVTLMGRFAVAALLWGGMSFVSASYGEDVRESAAQGDGASDAAPSGKSEETAADGWAEGPAADEGPEGTAVTVDKAVEAAVEAKEGKDVKEMSKKELLDDIKSFLDDDEVLGSTPSITKVSDASGAQYYMIKLGSDPAKRLDDLDQDMLVNVWGNVCQARVSVQTQRIARQNEFVKRNSENMVEQQRQLQLMNAARIAQVHQSMVPPRPPLPQAQPRPPQTSFSPPPNPPRQQKVR